MKQPQNVYRKNFSLIIAFLVLISVTFVVALVVCYNLTTQYAESEFATKKIDVLEETIKTYNNFFSNKIPEITLYQGYLTGPSAASYSYAVFNEYPFVKNITFYEMGIGSKTSADKVNKLNITL